VIFIRAVHQPADKSVILFIASQYDFRYVDFRNICGIECLLKVREMQDVSIHVQIMRVKSKIRRKIFQEMFYAQ